MAPRLCLLALLCLSALAPCRAGLPAPGAVELSTGLRLPFQAQPERSYCLLSAPCVHVNALMGQAPAPLALTWIHGVGIRSGTHSLSLLAEVPRGSSKAALLRAVLDEADVTANLTRGEGARSQDSQLAVGVIEEGQLLLVTLSACGLRLLVRLRELRRGGAVVPHFVVDTLDWQNLDAPHGIVGQTFPNRALPHAFAKAPYHVASPASPAAGLAAPGAREMSRQAALERQRVHTQRHAALDGVPGDYLTSGLLEPNCAFSRFEAATRALPKEEEAAEEGAVRPEEFVGDDHEVEEARELAPHAASTVRSALASWWSGPSTGSLGRKGGKLSASELKLISETQGTSEEAAEADAALDASSHRWHRAARAGGQGANYAGRTSRQGLKGWVAALAAEAREAQEVPQGVASVGTFTLSEEVDVREDDYEDNTVRAGAWSSHQGAGGLRGQDMELLAEMQGTQDGTEAQAQEPRPRSSMSAEAVQVLASMQGTAETDLTAQGQEGLGKETSPLTASA